MEIFVENYNGHSPLNKVPCTGTFLAASFWISNLSIGSEVLFEIVVQESDIFYQEIYEARCLLFFLSFLLAAFAAAVEPQ